MCSKRLEVSMSQASDSTAQFAGLNFTKFLIHFQYVFLLALTNLAATTFSLHTVTKFPVFTK